MTHGDCEDPSDEGRAVTSLHLEMGELGALAYPARYSKREWRYAADWPPERALLLAAFSQPNER
jgi:hypothetical protein